MLSTQQLQQLVPDIDRRETWACGPAGMTDALADLFESNGWADRLHIERFRPALAAVGDSRDHRGFTKSGTTVAAAGDTTLLAAGEDASGLRCPPVAGWASASAASCHWRKARSRTCAPAMSPPPRRAMASWSRPAFRQRPDPAPWLAEGLFPSLFPSLPTVRPLTPPTRPSRRTTQ